MSTHTIVTGLGGYLPPRRVTNQEILQRVCDTTGYRIPVGLIERGTGIQERRFAAPDEQPTDLACQAAKAALVDAGRATQDVDTVIFASASRDIAEPACANLLAHKLDISAVPAFDVSNACNSLLTAVDLAEALIQSGKANTVLVAAGEKCSYLIDYRITSKADLKHLLSGLTLGDAGGALILEAGENTDYGIHYSRARSFGEHWDLSVVMGGGTCCGRDIEASYFHCQGDALFALAVDKIAPELEAMLKTTGWQPRDIALVAAHQASRNVIERLARRVGIDPGRCALSMQSSGNTAAASIPLALHQARAAGKVQAGDKVLLVGGAAGFSVAVVGLVWGI